MLVFFFSVFMTIAVIAQSIEKFVTFHTKTKTYLSSKKSLKIDTKVH